MDEDRDGKLDVLAELRELRLRVAELEAQAAGPSPNEETSTRRGMLRLAGAAVVGGAAASLVGAQPVAASTGAMSYGANNDAGIDATVLTSTSIDATLDVHNTNSVEADSEYPDAVRGTATADGTGVHGKIENGNHESYGVWAENDGVEGLALVGDGGRAQLFLATFGTVGTPTGDHVEGEIVANIDGIFYCTASGSPGSWRKLAGPASAGTFHAVTPTRVYDSRAGFPFPSGIILALASFNTRTITVAHGRDGAGNVIVPDLVPVGATAVAANITVVATGGGGYLAVNPGGNMTAGASTINWSSSGQNLANGVTLALNNNRELTVICGSGVGGHTHFIVDITGYYL